jgi:hypothetical protein
MGKPLSEEAKQKLLLDLLGERVAVVPDDKAALAFAIIRRLCSITGPAGRTDRSE